MDVDPIMDGEYVSDVSDGILNSEEDGDAMDVDDGIN